ncbi:hypothetical protein SERLADRAFT_417786 [Serpula lacrymans var. lacrymans S7.9]|uniref:Uncharacterized protein n=1 Tax=Serpula lacrymans var. lacrymans (strain S7.9) TaxID=578457 RepID=F8P826_SERL9|nr:uncharacterized protein SERLADRAFT_417786 [Serpula lacrymans var. lacrymans S7.9]EGO20584.1 hypothetical protein SERLADRAFT_417786 [Serpula lacrymans var. lacrymans S7.9]
MVVTRRTPLVPAPASRTASSQALPRSGASHVEPDTINLPPSSPISQQRAALAGANNGLQFPGHDFNDSSNKKSKKKDKSKKAAKKSRKSNFQAFLDFLIKLITLSLTIYTLAVCPQDTDLQSPVCRGLHLYRRLVLEPYVLPPIQAAFAHPSIAPYVDRATPYVHQAVSVTTPILLRTQSEWNARVVPQWKKRVIPQWNKHVLPQLEKYVVPRIEALQTQIDPYRARVQQTYEQRVVPHARLAAYNIQRWTHKAQPYVVLAVSKTHAGYQAARPYAIPLGRQIGSAVQQFLLFLQEQRQKFVDPHVAKIWEKVKELSNRKPESSFPSKTDSSPPSLVSEDVTSIAESTHFSAAPTEVPSPSTSSDSPNETVVSSKDADNVYEAIHPTEAAEPTIFSADLPTSTLSSEAEATSPPFSESVQSASVVPPAISSLSGDLSSSIASASSLLEPSGGVPISIEILESASSVISESLHPTPSSIPTAASSVVPTHGAQPILTGSGRSDDDDIDLDAFYAELGLEEPDFQESSEPGQRPSLQARTQWEQIASEIKSGKVQLVDRFASIRKEAAAELKSSQEIRTSVDGLVADAEKYLRGAEVYLKNLNSEGRKREEKVALWERVVDKVDIKFGERLKETEGVVNGWYGAILDSETQQVEQVAAIVKDIAERGQVDLGLDYAWLDDVTYGDWQRYHALIETSDRFKQEALSIQNGRDLSAPADPVIPILEDLESEVHDVVIGFETRLRRIKRDGERAFSNYQKEEEKAPVSEPEAPWAPILPIPAAAEEYIPPVIGRNKEEVLEALGKVETPEDTELRITSDDLEMEPEEVVEVEDHSQPDATKYRTEL